MKAHFAMAALAFTLGLPAAVQTQTTSTPPSTTAPDAGVPTDSKDQQNQLKKQEKAASERAKADKAQRKALKQQDKAQKAAAKAGTSPQQ